jgi:hypothetical protein
LQQRPRADVQSCLVHDVDDELPPDPGLDDLPPEQQQSGY